MINRSSEPSQCAQPLAVEIPSLAGFQSEVLESRYRLDYELELGKSLRGFTQAQAQFVYNSSEYEGKRCIFLLRADMFTNDRRQKERTGKYGSPRLQYLQELVAQFQNASDEETKEKIVANLGNFAYDPYNYTFLRQLNILELFLDCLTEPNERLVEFAIGGICNACADPTNAAAVIQCGGIPLVIQCLSSPVRNTVNYALGSLYYLCNPTTENEILKPEVLDAIERFAAAGALNPGFSNLARAFLDRHVSKLD